ncbi:MAG: hypothetical protein KA140_06400 [Caldisericia bacterium]|nr:hypothetical protein [Caldisericia bacterium]
MKLSWIGKSALIWFGIVLIAIVFSLFSTENQILRIVVNDSQGIFLIVPLFAILSLGLGSLAKRTKSALEFHKTPWILYGIGSYIMLACVILACAMLFISYSPASYAINSILTMIVYALPIIAFVFVLGGFALELLGDRIKNRFSVWWLPMLMIVLFWASSFLLNNDGFRYNDPVYMMILALAFLLPAMLCSVIIQKGNREPWTISYWYIGSGFLIMFVVASVFLVTFPYVIYSNFFMIALSMMVMLAFLITGVDFSYKLTSRTSH